MQVTNKLELKDDMSEEEREVERTEGSDEEEKRSNKGPLINCHCFITLYHFFMLKVKKKISQHH